MYNPQSRNASVSLHSSCPFIIFVFDILGGFTHLKETALPKAGQFLKVARVAWEQASSGRLTDPPPPSGSYTQEENAPCPNHLRSGIRQLEVTPAVGAPGHNAAEPKQAVPLAFPCSRPCLSCRKQSRAHRGAGLYSLFTPVLLSASPCGPVGHVLPLVSRGPGTISFSLNGVLLSALSFGSPL